MVRRAGSIGPLVQDSSPLEEGLRSIPAGDRLKQAMIAAFPSKVNLLLIGSTGVGKSEIIQQTAQELGVGFVILDLSLLEPPDLVGLPVIRDNRTTYASPLILPSGGEGILCMEEFNRADPAIRASSLQLLSARRLHEYVLPKGWLVVAAVNPDDAEYEVQRLDPAFKARFLKLRVKADRRSWLKWARSSGVHPAILRLAESHDDLLEDVPPRTWTLASRILQGLAPDFLSNKTLLRDLLQGLLPRVWVDVLLSHIDEFPQSPGLDVYRILKDYDRDESTRVYVQARLEEGRTDVVGSLCRQIEAVLRGPELAKLVDESSIRLEAFESFLADMPGDHRDVLQIEFSRNPAATRLVSVQPSDVLRDYKGSPIERKIEHWLCEPARSHRLLTVINALRHHVETISDIFQFRMDRHAMICLGHFLRQVGPELTGELRGSLERHNVEPVYPRK